MFFRFLGYISASRLWNWLCCVVDYVLMCVGVAPRFSRMPCFVSVEPANVCGLRCVECALGSGRIDVEGALLDMGLFGRLLDMCGDDVLVMNFFFQGEPLLNGCLPDMIGMAHGRGIFTLCSTNAQQLDAVMARRLVECGLDRLIVSMDGHTQESYERYRVGGDIGRVYAGLRYMADAKRALGSRFPVVELQCLYLSSTEGSIDFLRSNYRGLGADRLVFKSAQFYDYERGHELMPSDEGHCRYRRLADGSYVLKGSLRGRCWRVVSGCVVDVRGGVRPCCFDKVGAFSYGSILGCDLGDIWRGDRARNFRRRVMTGRGGIDICCNCTE